MSDAADTSRPIAVHPLAELLPEMANVEREALQEDIKKNGQLEPIMINNKSLIIDGRHRYRCCIALAPAGPVRPQAGAPPPVFSVTGRLRKLIPAVVSSTALLPAAPPNVIPPERLGGKALIDATKKFEYPAISLPPMQFLHRFPGLEGLGSPPTGEPVGQASFLSFCEASQHALDRRGEPRFAPRQRAG
jgi:hypothetical protein